MAEISKSGTPSPCSLMISPEQTKSRTAGEDIAAGDAVYVKSDGFFWRCSGAAANAAALYVGCAAGAAKAGEPCTAVHGVNMYYGTGLPPGARLYVSGTVPGGLADAASTGGTVPVAYVLDTTRIHIFNPNR